jgi:hypothetical protein
MAASRSIHASIDPIDRVPSVRIPQTLNRRRTCPRPSRDGPPEISLRAFAPRWDRQWRVDHPRPARIEPAGQPDPTNAAFAKEHREIVLQAITGDDGRVEEERGLIHSA